MSFTKFLPVFAFGFAAACGSAEKDDTSDVSFDEPSAEPASVPPSVSLTPDAVFFDFQTVVSDSTTVGSISTENGPMSGSFVIFLADSANWAGSEDTDNACAIVFSITPDSATFDETFITAGAWTGWNFPAENFLGTTPSCEELDEDYLPLVDRWSTAGFGVGFGPLTAQMSTDLQDVLSNYSEDQVGTWEDDWAPYIHEAYVMVDGLDAPYSINLGRAYAVNEDGTLATANENGEADPAGQYLLRQKTVDENGDQNTYAVDGYYTTIPWGGLNPDYFLQ